MIMFFLGNVDGLGSHSYIKGVEEMESKLYLKYVFLSLFIT